MAHKLAEETVHQILAYVLEVPDEDFADVSGLRSSPFARRQYSTSDALRVCKRWMRIGTPLLYETVIIRSAAQAQALSYALTTNPTFAPFVKKMRVESGFGPSMGKALRAATVLRDIHVCLDLHSNDDVKAMWGALAAINPTRVILSALWHNDSSNANTTLARIGDASQSWKNFTTLVFPASLLQQTHTMRSVFLRMSNISSIHISGHLMYLDQLERFLEAWPSCVICFTATNATRDVEGLAPFLAKYAGRFVVDWENIPFYAMTERRTTARPPMHGAPADVRRKIWSLILRQLPRTHSHRGFAFRSVRWEPPPWQRHAVRHMSVCKLFLDIYSALAATSVALRSHSMAVRYVRFLRPRTALWPTVHTVVLNGLDLDCQRRDLLALLPLISPNLRAFGCNASLSDTDMLSEKLGSNLEELNISLTLPLADAATILPKFTFAALRRLWFATLEDVHEPPSPFSISLPSLEELAFGRWNPPWVLNMFCQTSLPSLRILTFLPRDEEPFRSFLHIHGEQCENVRTHPTNLGAALSLCPNLRTLLLSDVEEVPPLQALSFNHPTFAKLELPDLGVSASGSCILPFMKKREMAAYLENMSEFFDIVSPTAFPSLREIVAGRLEWPIIPRKIPGNLAVKWAEVLLAKGIRLVDEHGVGWRPRLQPTRDD